jgi:hypothetical protein
MMKLGAGFWKLGQSCAAGVDEVMEEEEGRKKEKEGGGRAEGDPRFFRKN